MARIKKIEADLEFFTELAAACGGETLEQIGTESKSWIDSGNLALNYVLSGKFVGGGLSTACCAEFFGPSSTGKSLLAMNFMRGVQNLGGIAVYIDAERAVDKTFAIKSSKVDSKQMVVLYPDTLKSAFRKITSIILKVRENPKYDGKPICIVVDSIAALPSDEEFAETTIDVENSSAAVIKRAGARIVDQPGVHAKTTSRELRKIMGFVADNNATVIFINQIRSNIGVIYGQKTDSASGGMSLKFYCSTRLELKSQLEVIDKETKITRGLYSKFKLVKSRFTPPRQVIEHVKLMFDSGIDPFGGLLGALLHAERIESNGKGNYLVKKPWCVAEGVTFKASREQNTVPLDIIRQNPQLVDANSVDEIEYYVKLMGKQIETDENCDLVEIVDDE